MRTAPASTAAYELMVYVILLAAVIGMFFTLTAASDDVCVDSGPALDTVLTQCELVAR